MDSTVEMVQVAHDDCKNDPKFYETLLEDAQKPLYPGCRNFTKLSVCIGEIIQPKSMIWIV